MAITRDEIKKRVKKVLLAGHLKDVDESDLMFDTPLFELGVGVDSVATLELLVALEDEFRISIDEEKLTAEDLQTIDSLSEFISKYI